MRAGSGLAVARDGVKVGLQRTVELRLNGAAREGVDLRRALLDLVLRDGDALRQDLESELEVVAAERRRGLPSVIALVVAEGDGDGLTARDRALRARSGVIGRVARRAEGVSLLLARVTVLARMRGGLRHLLLRNDEIIRKLFVRLGFTARPIRVRGVLQRDLHRIVARVGARIRAEIVGDGVKSRLQRLRRGDRFQIKTFLCAVVLEAVRKGGIRDGLYHRFLGDDEVVFERGGEPRRAPLIIRGVLQGNSDLRRA